MDESHEVLVGVAEAHASSHSALEEARRAAHAERHHALVLVPDVHHAVNLRIARLHLVYAQQLVPVVVELPECLVHLLRGVEASHHLAGLLLVYHLRCRKFLVLLVLHVPQQEDEVLLLAWLQGDLDVV